MPYANVLREDAPISRNAMGTGRVQPYVAAAALSKGDFLVLSSGQAAQAIALPGSANSASASGGSLAILGVALHDCAANGTVLVQVADDTAEFLLRLYNSTASSAEPQDVSVGTAYQLSRYRGPGTEAFYVLSQTTSNGECTVVEKSPQSAADEDYGFVWVKIPAARRAF